MLEQQCRQRIERLLEFCARRRPDRRKGDESQIRAGLRGFLASQIRDFFGEDRQRRPLRLEYARFAIGMNRILAIDDLHGAEKIGAPGTGHRGPIFTPAEFAGDLPQNSVNEQKLQNTDRNLFI